MRKKEIYAVAEWVCIDGDWLVHYAWFGMQDGWIDVLRDVDDWEKEKKKKQYVDREKKMMMEIESRRRRIERASEPCKKKGTTTMQSTPYDRPALQPVYENYRWEKAKTTTTTKNNIEK